MSPDRCAPQDTEGTPKRRRPGKYAFFAIIIFQQVLNSYLIFEITSWAKYIAFSNRTAVSQTCWHLLWPLSLLGAFDCWESVLAHMLGLFLRTKKDRMENEIGVCLVFWRWKTELAVYWKNWWKKKENRSHGLLVSSKREIELLQPHRPPVNAYIIWNFGIPSPHLQKILTTKWIR